MVHADGTRYVRSGQRVERLTSTLLDMAIEMSMPIVPMYFAGGLPEKALDQSLRCRIATARKDYIFGPPIMPDELIAWPYVDVDAGSWTPSTRWPIQRCATRAELRSGEPDCRCSSGCIPLESIWFVSRMR